MRTHWKMSLQISSLMADELEAFEPRREPKLGSATEDRLRMAAWMDEACGSLSTGGG